LKPTNFGAQILSSIDFLVPFELPALISNLDRTYWTLAFICFLVYIFLFLVRRVLD